MIGDFAKGTAGYFSESFRRSFGCIAEVVQKHMNVLKAAGRIERIGGKRYGHWKIND